MRAGHVARLVLDPHGAAGRPEPGGELLDRLERRLPEAPPVDGGDRVVEPPDEPDDVPVGPTGRPRRVVAAGQRPIAHERRRVLVAREGERSGVDDPAQDVVDVVPRLRRRTAGGEDPVVGHPVAAAGADQADREARSAGIGPALSSGGPPMGPPRTGPPRTERGGRSHRHRRADPRVELVDQPVPDGQDRPAISVQNSGRRRASNSSSGTPCCSTQV